MDPLTSEAPAPKKEKPAADPKKPVLDAIAARDAITSQFWADPKEQAVAQAKADVELARAVQSYTHDEKFDAAKEPLLAQLVALADRRHVNAIRLLLMPRTKLALQESGDKEKPWGPAFVGWNGLQLLVPRQVLMHMPDPLAEILLAAT